MSDTLREKLEENFWPLTASLTLDHDFVRRTQNEHIGIIADHIDALEARMAALERRVPDFSDFIEACKNEDCFKFNKLSSQHETGLAFLNMARALHRAGLEADNG